MYKFVGFMVLSVSWWVSMYFIINGVAKYKGIVDLWFVLVTIITIGFITGILNLCTKYLLK